MPFASPGFAVDPVLKEITACAEGSAQRNYIPDTECVYGTTPCTDRRRAPNGTSGGVKTAGLASRVTPGCSCALLDAYSEGWGDDPGDVQSRVSGKSLGVGDGLLGPLIAGQRGPVPPGLAADRVLHEEPVRHRQDTARPQNRDHLLVVIRGRREPGVVVNEVEVTIEVVEHAGYLTAHEGDLSFEACLRSEPSCFMYVFLEPVDAPAVCGRLGGLGRRQGRSSPVLTVL